MRKLAIGLIILLMGLGIVFVIYNSVNRDEGGTFGIPRPSEHILVGASQRQNVSSISFDTADDTIIYGIDDPAGDEFASLSVGDTVRFSKGNEGGTITPLEIDITYYVVTASLSDRFEVSKTKGGSVIDLTGTSSGGEEVREVFAGEANVDGKKYHTFSVIAEEKASATIFFVGSVDNDIDFAASNTATNAWDKLDVIDAEDEASIDGDTGLAFTGSEDQRLFYIENATALNWIGVIFEEFESGSFTIKLDSQ